MGIKEVIDANKDKKAIQIYLEREDLYPEFVKRARAKGLSKSAY